MFRVLKMKILPTERNFEVMFIKFHVDGICINEHYAQNCFTNLNY
jgi:hypothetical protein